VASAADNPSLPVLLPVSYDDPPPLIVTKEEADVAVDVLEECIKSVGA